MVPNKTGVYSYEKHVLSLTGEPWVQWRGQLPPNIQLNKFFDVKIQEAGANQPLFCYNADKSLLVYIETANCPDVNKLYKLVVAFKPCGGRKAYFKCCFRAPGELFIATSPVFACQW